MPWKTSLGALAVAVAMVAGCSGDDGEEGSSSGDDRPAVDVPDPCALLDPETVADLAGGSPGTGSVKGLAPEQRQVCAFADGLNLAVEVGENYEPTVELIRAAPGDPKLEDVDGVGSAAIWQDLGEGDGQLFAKGDDHFVMVTVPGGGREVGERLAEAMLAEL